MGNRVSVIKENWIFTCKRMKLGTFSIALTKINLRWINGLNISPENVKLLVENREKIP